MVIEWMVPLGWKSLLWSHGPFHSIIYNLLCNGGEFQVLRQAVRVFSIHFWNHQALGDNFKIVSCFNGVWYLICLEVQKKSRTVGLLDLFPGAVRLVRCHLHLLGTCRVPESSCISWRTLNLGFPVRNLCVSSFVRCRGGSKGVPNKLVFLGISWP